MATQNILSTSTETVPVGDLTPYPGNARTNNLDTITESLTAHGQYRPLIVQKSTGYILCGNHTHAAITELGWTHAAVQYVDVDDEQAKKILLVDNRASDTATYDDDLLAELLDSLTDLEGTGFDDLDLDALTDVYTPPDLDDLADQVGEPKADDGWPSISLRVPHTVKAAWNSHLDTHNDDGAAALASLLGVEHP